MNKREISKYMRKLGRKGAKAWLLATTPEQRSKIAKKASAAGLKVRREKAAARRAVEAAAGNGK